MENAIKLRDQLGQLIDRLIESPRYFEDDEVRELIDELREHRREVLSYIRNPKRFDESYLRAFIGELNETIAKARKFV